MIRHPFLKLSLFAAPLLLSLAACDKVPGLSGDPDKAAAQAAYPSLVPASEILDGVPESRQGTSAEEQEQASRDQAARAAALRRKAGELSSKSFDDDE